MSAHSLRSMASAASNHSLDISFAYLGGAGGGRGGGPQPEAQGSHPPPTFARRYRYHSTIPSHSRIYSLNRHGATGPSGHAALQCNASGHAARAGTVRVKGTPRRAPARRLGWCKGGSALKSGLGLDSQAFRFTNIVCSVCLAVSASTEHLDPRAASTEQSPPHVV